MKAFLTLPGSVLQSQNLFFPFSLKDSSVVELLKGNDTLATDTGPQRLLWCE